LRALALATFTDRDAVVIERDTLLTQKDRLRHLLLKLTRMHFGARSESLPEEQLQPGLEALEQAIAKDEAQAEKQDPGLRKDNTAKPRASRGALPPHLPRIELMLAPEDTACPCWPPGFRCSREIARSWNICRALAVWRRAIWTPWPIYRNSISK
jgi:transposase